MVFWCSKAHNLVSAKITWWLCTYVHVCVCGIHGHLHVCVYMWECRDSGLYCLLSEMEYVWQCEVLGTTTSWHSARWKEGRHRKESSWGGLSQPQAAVTQKSIIMIMEGLRPYRARIMAEERNGILEPERQQWKICFQVWFTVLVSYMFSS